MDLEKIKNIHFIGIGGIGLSAIAKLMKKRGKIVSGSDANDSEILEELRKLGVKIFIGQLAENLSDDTDLVIYTLAIPKNNPERAKAKKLKIPAISYPEALGLLFNKKFGIAICGTHGKSTTTSLAGLILANGGLDPTVVVGSKVPAFGGNLRIGKSDCMVIEACEYERAFMEYWPRIVVLSNIELDHTDYYKNIDDFKSAFEKFIGHLPKNGVLIANGDDEQVKKVKIKIQNDNSKFKIVNFGFEDGNDVVGFDVRIESGITRFKVKYYNKSLGEFFLRIPGKFNVFNALATIALGLEMNIPTEIIRKSLADYSGIWRRFEIKGEYKGATVISDYAHHPTAVRETIKAAREFYPDRKIFAVFQPHQHNRTKMLYKDFLESFDAADILILAEIFEVTGREEKKDQDVSSKKMAEDMENRIVTVSDSRCSEERLKPFLRRNNIFYAKDLPETRKLIDEKLKSKCILLIMGAGDIYKIANDLVK